MSGRTRKGVLGLVGVLGVMTVIAAPARATVVDLSPSLDCTIEDFDTGNCDDTAMASGIATSIATRHAGALLTFDLSGLPSGATIESAELHMAQVSGDGQDGGQQINPFPLTHAFTSDVTFYEYDGVNEWPDGFDWGSSLNLGEAGSQVTVDDDGAWVWDVTTMAANWASGAEDNDGMFVGDLDQEHQGTGWAWFASSEETDSDLQPYLEVDYEAP
jgi:hypothetical protein